MMKSILDALRRLFKRKRRVAELPPEVLARVREEADFLRKAHGVRVRELEPGEKPGPPSEA